MCGIEDICPEYWRDEQLSFKGLKNNANNRVINQLSLNVEMLKKSWKPGKTQMYLEVNPGVFQTLSSTMVLTRTCTPSLGQTSCSGCLKMGTSPTQSGLQEMSESFSEFLFQINSKSEVPDDTQ